MSLEIEVEVDAWLAIFWIKFWYYILKFRFTFPFVRLMFPLIGTIAKRLIHVKVKGTKIK
jgi:hypothetical protein